MGDPVQADNSGAAHPVRPSRLRQPAKGLRWSVRAGAPPTRLAAVVADPDAFLTEPALHYKHTAEITVARVPSSGQRGEPGLVIRRLSYRRGWLALRDCLRPARPHRALRRGLELEAAGVATPRHWAAAVRRRWLWPVAGYLVTEEVPDAVTLRAHVRERGGLARETVDRLADLLAHLHDANFSHRDLKSTNVLLDRSLQPWLIDLDSLRRYCRLPAYWARSNLIRFAREFSAYPLLLKWQGRRFLRRYCRQRGMPGQFRSLDRQIVRALWLRQ